MNDDDFEERCWECQHYWAEHDEDGCQAFDADRYDTVCPCFIPG